MEDELLKARCLISRALGLPVEDIDDEASIETLEAWDSLGHLSIVQEIERDICAELSGEDILSLDGIRDIARLL